MTAGMAEFNTAWPAPGLFQETALAEDAWAYARLGGA